MAKHLLRPSSPYFDHVLNHVVYINLLKPMNANQNINSMLSGEKYINKSTKILSIERPGYVCNARSMMEGKQVLH